MDGEHILMGVEADTGVNYLEIIEVTNNDIGTYICVVTTKLGMAESTFDLVVNPQGSYICTLLVCVHVCLYTHVFACVCSCVYISVCLCVCLH